MGIKMNKHKVISLIKSIIRLGSGFFSLLFLNIFIFIIGYTIAEIFGILEEQDERLV